MGDDSQLQLEAPHITTQPLIIENSEEQWHSVTHYLMLFRMCDWNCPNCHVDIEYWVSH